MEQDDDRPRDLLRRRSERPNFLRAESMSEREKERFAARGAAVYVAFDRTRQPVSWQRLPPLASPHFRSYRAICRAYCAARNPRARSACGASCLLQLAPRGRIMVVVVGAVGALDGDDDDLNSCALGPSRPLPLARDANNYATI